MAAQDNKVKDKEKKTRKKIIGGILSSVGGVPPIEWIFPASLLPLKIPRHSLNFSH